MWIVVLGAWGLGWMWIVCLIWRRGVLVKFEIDVGVCGVYYSNDIYFQVHLWFFVIPFLICVVEGCFFVLEGEGAFVFRCASCTQNNLLYL
jgi:hypothetical protein